MYFVYDHMNPLLKLSVFLSTGRNSLLYSMMNQSHANVIYIKKLVSSARNVYCRFIFLKKEESLAHSES